jgi:hypothetical protein
LPACDGDEIFRPLIMLDFPKSSAWNRFAETLPLGISAAVFSEKSGLIFSKKTSGV